MPKIAVSLLRFCFGTFCIIIDIRFKSSFISIGSISGSSNARNSLNLLVVELLSLTLRQRGLIAVNFILSIE